MAGSNFTVSEMGGKFRVMKGGKPQDSVDKGGFKTRQKALDAAMQANKQTDTAGSGAVDQAADALENRQNRLDRAMNRATGR